MFHFTNESHVISFLALTSNITNISLLSSSAAIINYAPILLLRLSSTLSDTQAQLFLAAIALTKVVGVGIGESDECLFVGL